MAVKSWLIAEGVYSDYRIHGVVLGTKRHAEAVAERLRGHRHPHVFVQATTTYPEGEFPEPVAYHYFSHLERGGCPVEVVCESRVSMPIDYYDAGNAGLPDAKHPITVKSNGRGRNFRVDVAALNFHEGKAVFDAEVAKRSPTRAATG